MGKSLNVMIKDVPAGFKLYSEYYDRYLKEKRNNADIYIYPIYSDEATMLIRFIKQYVQQLKTNNFKRGTKPDNTIFYTNICFDKNLKQITRRKEINH